MLGGVAKQLFAHIGRNSFYRAMSTAEYNAVKAGNGLNSMKGKEPFVSPSKAYAKDFLSKPGYDVLVKFNMKPGATNYFKSVGVLHRPPAGSSGWAGRANLLFKSEKGVMNLGIQSNIHMFNPWIKSFNVVR